MTLQITCTYANFAVLIKYRYHNCASNYIAVLLNNNMVESIIIIWYFIDLGGEVDSQVPTMIIPKHITLTGGLILEYIIIKHCLCQPQRAQVA